jgi:amino acid adenylation domain-containing protein
MGDRGRFLQDGCIEYIGRIDRQVKINGQRIELGVIESVLIQHDSVQLCAVVLIKPSDFLAAFMTLTDSTSTTSDEVLQTQLVAYAKLLLPQYMIPLVYRVLSEMPTNTSGKLDRRVLPDMLGDWSADIQFVTPSTALEASLADAFQAILGLQSAVSTAASFFDLGGNSLAAVRLVHALRAADNIGGIPTPLGLADVFEHPTVSALAGRIQTLQAESDGGAGAARVRPPLVPTPAADLHPLSANQEQMLVLFDLDRTSPVYNMAHVQRFDEQLDASVVRRCLEALVERHPTLRTHIVEDGATGEAMQRVAGMSEYEVVFEVLAVEDGSGSGEAFVSRLCDVPFDLYAGPWARFSLLQHGEVSDEEVGSTLVLGMHHIAGDGWSSGVLTRELAALYAAAAADAFLVGVQLCNAAGISPLAVQYVDFVHWQRHWLGVVSESQLAYWRVQLGGDGGPAPLELPTDHPRPKLQTFNGRNFNFAVPTEVASEVAVLARLAGASVFMVVLAAFDLLLCRYSRQQEVCVGTAYAGRNEPGTQNMVGYFVNTLPLIVSISENPTAAKLVSRVRSVVLGAFEHADLPLARIVAGLKVPRDGSRSPVFQSMFSYDEILQDELETAQLSTALAMPPALSDDTKESAAMPSTSKFDISLGLQQVRTSGPARDSQGPLGASFEYNTDLFDKISIMQMARQYKCLLQSMCASVDTPIEQQLLSMICEDELVLVRQSLPQSGGEALTSGVSDSLHSQFKRSAKLAPQAVALVTLTETLAYDDLNQRATGLANHLREQFGICADVFVGVCCEKCPMMLVALLGILKSGGAYVSLDLEYPEGRMRVIAEDCGLAVLLVQQNVLSCIGTSDSDAFTDGQHALGETPIVLMSESGHLQNGDGASRSHGTELAWGGDACTPCYILYTSGSTGRPKGILVEHGNVIHYVHATLLGKRVRPDGPGCRSLFVSSLVFDSHVYDVYPTFACGGTLVAYPQKYRLDKIAEIMVTDRITSIGITPSELSLIPVEITELQSIYVGGEALPAQMMAEWSAKVPYFFNGYGPTEATVDVTSVRCTPDMARPSSIGQPHVNMRAYIVGAADVSELMGVGVPGELVMCGPQITRGYVNLPEQTAERFVPNPFQEEADASYARMYRTGDLCRWLPDGTIGYMGRIDQQVKLRGFRIELGEIENVLLQRAAVSRCAVALRKTDDGDAYLAAYVQLAARSADGGEALVSALAAYAAAALPQYMVPAVFMVLEQLPLTSSGKIDRGKLPAPKEGDWVGGAGAAEFAAPKTALEASLADAFQAVLGLQSAGSTVASFFDLGGNSLAAVRLVHLIRAGTSSVSLRDVFANPSVCGLAAAIESLTSDGTGEDRPGVVVPGGASTRVPGAVVFDGGPAVGNCVRFAVQLLAVILIKLIYAAALYPLLVLADRVHESHGITATCVAAPAIGALYPFTASIFVFVLKWLLVGRLTRGRYRMWSCVFLRWWFLERLLGSLEALAEPIQVLWARPQGLLLPLPMYSNNE